ncbi:hypothetical protein SANTM175S_02901 [Streptomyces antimycoticus]
MSERGPGPGAGPGSRARAASRRAGASSATDSRAGAGQGDHGARVEDLHEGGVPVATHDDVAGQEQADAAVGLKRLMAEGRGAGAHEYS